MCPRLFSNIIFTWRHCSGLATDHCNQDLSVCRSAHIDSLIAGGRPRSWVGVTLRVSIFVCKYAAHPTKRQPNSTVPKRDNEECHARLRKTLVALLTMRLPPFGLCGARLVDANRIGGARIVVCFHIYRSRSKEQKESIVVSIVQVKRYCHVTYATQFCGDAMLPSSCMHASPFGNTARDGKRSDATPLKQLGTTPCLALLVNFIRGF